LDCKEDERVDEYMEFNTNTPVFYNGQATQPNHTQSGLYLLVNMACYEGDAEYKPPFANKLERRVCGAEIVASLILADINEHRLKILKRVSKLEAKKYDISEKLLESRRTEKKNNEKKATKNEAVQKNNEEPIGQPHLVLPLQTLPPEAPASK